MLISDYSELKKRLAARAPRRVEEAGIAESAVALILAPGKLGLEALLIRRAERAGDPWSGHIALPGGRREPGDEDRLATARRETKEEVGLALPPSALLGALDDETPGAPRPPLVIRPYAFGLETRPATSLSDEVADVIWLPLAELPGREGKASVPIRGVPVEVPCFNRGGAVIWGLTYRILNGFLKLAA